MSQGNARSIDALREALFAAIEGVRAGTLDIDKARAINDLGKTLIDSARVEVQYLEATGGGESTFLDSAIGARNLPPGLPGGPAPATPGNGIVGITRHRLAG